MSSEQFFLCKIKNKLDQFFALFIFILIIFEDEANQRQYAFDNKSIRFKYKFNH